MKYIILFCIGILCMNLNAQNTDNQWEIAGDLRPLLTTTHQHQYLFFRKNFTKNADGKSKNIGHRYGLWIRKAQLSAKSLRISHMMFTIGKEWQYPKKNLKINYGIDNMYRLNYWNDFQDNYPSQYTITFGLNPLIGVEYKLTDYIHLSVESAFGLYYNYQYSYPNKSKHEFVPATLPLYRLFFSINL